MLRMLAAAWSILCFQGIVASIFAQQPPNPAPFQKTVFYGANFAGEQIDPLTGNLNYTLPVLLIQSSPHWKTPLLLSYNSQIWRADSRSVHSSAVDIGYGYGWNLRFGAIQPIDNSSGTQSYAFLDESGAAHALQLSNSSGLWTVPSQGLSYDPRHRL